MVRQAPPQFCSAGKSRAVTAALSGGRAGARPPAFRPRRRPAEPRRSRRGAPKRSGSLRRVGFVRRPLAVVGYGGKFGYDYFVEGRFLVSTDDAYVGAITAIIAAKATGHLMQVPVVDNQVVHQGDLLALIDDGDYQIAVDSAQAKVDTQDATIARFGRQIDAQARSSPRPRRRWTPPQAQLRSAEADSRARGARIRPFVQARADQLRLAAAARTGDRRPRPNGRRARRRPRRAPPPPQPRSKAPRPISTS